MNTAYYNTPEIQDLNSEEIDLVSGGILPFVIGVGVGVAIGRAIWR